MSIYRVTQEKLAKVNAYNSKNIKHRKMKEEPYERI